MPSQHHARSSQTAPSHASTMRGQQSKRHQISPRRAEMHISSLPRFHPAVYCAPNNSSESTSGSSSSDMMASPFAGGDSPQPPLSPHSVQLQFSEAQARLWHYAREAHGSAWSRPSSAHGHRRQPSSPGLSSALAGENKRHSPRLMGRRPKPISPHLHPLGTPSGHVTPLSLEINDLDIEDNQGGYLVAGAMHNGGAVAHLTEAERENLVEALIEKETGADGRR